MAIKHILQGVQLHSVIDNYHSHDHGIFYRTQPTFVIFGKFAAVFGVEHKLLQ